MWFVLVFVCIQGFLSVNGLDLDSSLRHQLEHFSTTRNDAIKPEMKTKARDYIMKTFKDFGLDTWTEEFPSNLPKYPGINVVGRVNGRYTGTSKDKILIIGSHYDTVETTNGVDDNGSGISALLQALTIYKSSNNGKCSQDYTLLFVAFDLEEYQVCSLSNRSSCSCSGILCGSGSFVTNLTRYVNDTGATVQGAFILETMMNFNTTPNSQSLPLGSQGFIADEYARIKNNEFRGDFLAVIGRKTDDNELMTNFVSNFDQGRFKAYKISLPFSGKPTGVPNDFLRSDHAQFWRSTYSWPAIFVTDTANFRGFMKTCYHKLCDNLASVTPDMITFLGKTTNAVERAAHNMTGRNCPKVTYCAEETRIANNKQTISSPLYPSSYPNNITCGWVRESEYPQKLVFESFDLENSTDCKSNDYVEVIAGNRTFGPFCGSNLPAEITASEKKIQVRFVSDGFVGKKGFKITWITNAPPTASAGRVHGHHLLIIFLTIISYFVLHKAAI